MIKIKCRKVVGSDRFTYRELKGVGKKLVCVIKIIFYQNLSERGKVYPVSTFKNNLNVQV